MGFLVENVFVTANSLVWFLSFPFPSSLWRAQ